MLLLIILIRFEHIDELARLEFEIKALKDKAAKVDSYRADVTCMYDKVSKFTALWTLRSIPLLRFMKAIRFRVRDYPERAVELLQIANDGFASLDQILGPRR